jgi:hypothetical protein
MEPTCFGFTTFRQIVFRRKDHPPPYNISCNWLWGLRKTQRREKIRRFLHDEKFCLLEPHYHATKFPKQLIYNYITIRTWKHK